ncbi:MAG: hypothetical protein H6Q90_173 [Deltaproteobacteria bacterium]|nr:hypothetical protein [Deltaproteobacteria bacterium]
MLIIYGHRSYGRVDSYGGEHAQSQFAHLYYMPLIPMSSFWVTRTSGGSVHGFEIRSSVKSIIAAYLRWWGPVLALLVFSFARGVIGALAAAPIVAAVAYAWRWRAVRGTKARRQSDCDRLVFGSRCPPMLMTADMRQQLRRSLDARWSKLGGGRSPEDVVSFGARTPEDSLVAYGLLRLAAIEHGDRAAAAAADRIFDGLDPERLAGSPYRGDAGVAFVAAEPGESELEIGEPSASDAPADWSARVLCSVGSCVGVLGPSGACKTCGKRPGDMVDWPPPSSTQRTPWWAAPISAGLKFSAIFVIVGSLAVLGWGAKALRATTDVDARFLAREASSSSYVEVVCDELELIGTFEDGTNGYVCTTGDRILPVAGLVERVAPGITLVGELHERDGDGHAYQWPLDLRTDPATTMGYLEVRSSAVRQLRRVAGVLGLLGLLGIVIGYLLVRRRRGRARRGCRTAT